MTYTVGSLCSGYGGLDLGLAMVVPTETAWVAETDPWASKVLDARIGAPNLGDLTAVDWSAVPPVDIVTAGFPCQDLSYAGRGAGLDGEHSGLWFEVLRAVRDLRPRWVVVENVNALVRRGLDVVTHGLASVGYVGSWVCVRASDVGACHRRERVFLVAADAERRLLAHAGPGGVPGAPGAGEGRAEQRERVRADAGHGAGPAADAAGRCRPDQPPRADDAPVGAVAGAGHRAGGGPGTTGVGDDGGSAGVVGWIAAPDAGSARRQGQTDEDALTDAGVRSAADADYGADDRERTRSALGGRGGTDWGAYAPAIARHAAVLGRDAPRPVDDAGRLNPALVEWMMMLPAGWVTDVVTSRTAALRCLGNGVVPLQAAYALADLFARLDDFALCGASRG